MSRYGAHVWQRSLTFNFYVAGCALLDRASTCCHHRGILISIVEAKAAAKVQTLFPESDAIVNENGYIFALATICSSTIAC